MTKKTKTIIVVAVTIGLVYLAYKFIPKILGLSSSKDDGNNDDGSYNIHSSTDNFNVLDKININSLEQNTEIYLDKIINQALDVDFVKAVLVGYKDNRGVNVVYVEENLYPTGEITDKYYVIWGRENENGFFVPGSQDRQKDKIFTFYDENGNYWFSSEKDVCETNVCTGLKQIVTIDTNANPVRYKKTIADWYYDSDGNKTNYDSWV